MLYPDTRRILFSGGYLMRFTIPEKHQWQEIKKIYLEAFPKRERKPYFMLPVFPTASSIFSLCCIFGTAFSGLRSARHTIPPTAIAPIITAVKNSRGPCFLFFPLLCPVTFLLLIPCLFSFYLPHAANTDKYYCSLAC